MYEENPGRALSWHEPGRQWPEPTRDTHIIICQAQRAFRITVINENVPGHDQAGRQRLCRFDNPARHRLGITGYDLAEDRVVILPGNAIGAIIGRLYPPRERYRLLRYPGDAHRDQIPCFGYLQESPCADPASYGDEENEHENNEHIDDGKQGVLLLTKLSAI